MWNEDLKGLLRPFTSTSEDSPEVDWESFIGLWSMSLVVWAQLKRSFISLALQEIIIITYSPIKYPYLVSQDGCDPPLNLDPHTLYIFATSSLHTDIELVDFTLTFPP